MRLAPYIMWCDLETTGVDEEQDAIIEIACILTDIELNELPDGRFQAVVMPEETSALGRMIKTRAVWAMHTVNGLIDQLVGKKGLPPGIVAGRVIDWLKAHNVGARQAMLGGSGVSHFDRRFLKWDMRQLFAYLDHPTYDIGVTRRQMVAAGIEVPPYDKGKDHRAMVDIRCHLAEARWQRWFFKFAHASEAEYIPAARWLFDTYGEEAFDYGSETA